MSVQEVCAIIIASVAVAGFIWNRMSSYASKNENAHNDLGNRIENAEKSLGDRIDQGNKELHDIKNVIIKGFMKSE